MSYTQFRVLEQEDSQLDRILESMSRPSLPIGARLLRSSDIRMGARPKESLITGVVLISMSMTIGGCGFNYTYSKPGISQQERAKDHYECKQESQKFSAVAMRGTMVAGSDPDWTTYKECLEARGYTVTVGDTSSNNAQPSRSTSPDDPCASYARTYPQAEYKDAYARCQSILRR